MDEKSFKTPHVVNTKSFESYPTDWNAIFKRNSPLGVEIGFGNGEYLVHWAKRKPDWNFVGIDRSFGSTKRLQKRVLQNSVENVRIINDDAPFTLRELFSDNSISQIIMNFPDPWPKKRHRGRRMLQRSFIETLAAVLEMGGIYKLMTDQNWLAEEAQGLLIESSFFKASNIEKNPQRWLSTKYEIKWRDSGSDLFHIAATKKESAIISRILQEGAMPHLKISKEVTPGKILGLNHFEDSVDDRLFVIKEVFNDFKGDNFLLRIITKDSDYQQDFYLRVARAENEWIVKLDEASSPYRTPGFKMAVTKIGHLLSGE